MNTDSRQSEKQKQTHGVVNDYLALGTDTLIVKGETALPSKKNNFERSQEDRPP